MHFINKKSLKIISYKNRFGNISIRKNFEEKKMKKKKRREISNKKKEKKFIIILFVMDA